MLALLVSVVLCVALVQATGTLSPGQRVLTLACWFLILAGIAGTALAGRGVSWGWLILFGLQPLWIAYALVTGQHGFIPGALLCGIAQLNGFVRCYDPSPKRAQETGKGGIRCTRTSLSGL